MEIPYDPDFDTSDVASKKSASALNAIDSKWAFIAGTIFAVLTLGTLGFLITVFGGGTSTATGGSARVATVRPGITPPAPQAAPLPPPEERVGTFRVVDPKTDHIRGPVKAPVTIIEYSDTECPFCRRFHPTMQAVIAAYPDKVRWVYRHFPLRSLHRKAAKEAEALECAGELGGKDVFWKYTDRLFDVTPSNDGLDSAELPKIAAFVGLSAKKFETCLNSGKYATHVKEDEDDAVSAGGTGTPYSVVISGENKIPVSGAVPVEEMKRILEPFVR